MTTPRSERPIGPVAGFHHPALDGLTLREFTILLMAHAHRTHNHHETPEDLVVASVIDAEVILATLEAD